MSGRVDIRIVPPSVADARGLAFGETMARALDETDFHKILFERIDAAPAAALPFLIREFSVEEFVEPGMREAVVRRLLKGAFELHRLKANVAGVRAGLARLGIRVHWTQWFQATPPAAPGTHLLTVFLSEYLFENQSSLLDERAQRAAARMIRGSKRASQSEELRYAVGLPGRPAVTGLTSGAQVRRAGARVAAATSGAARLAIAGLAQGLGVTSRKGRTRAATTATLDAGLAGLVTGAQIARARLRIA